MIDHLFIVMVLVGGLLLAAPIIALLRYARREQRRAIRGNVNIPAICPVHNGAWSYKCTACQRAAGYIP